MKKKFFLFLSMFFLCCGIIFQMSGIDSVPNTINVTYGKSIAFKFNLPITITEKSTNVLSFENGQDKSKIEIVPQKPGATQVNINLFGMPVKSVSVNVHTPKDVIPGGQSIGVALYTKGALVVGTSDIKDVNGNIVNPAKEAGLKSGDIIERVNGVLINNADHMIDIINSINSDKQTQIDIIRDGDQKTILVTPVKDISDGKYRLGIWVRDSMAGVGTLSFYDPITMKYASLGHAIYDADTKTLLNVKSGKVVETDIFGIKYGSKGDPGELKGTYDSSKEKLGNITKNNDFGLYGSFYRQPDNTLYKETIKTALIEEVETGPAKILCTIDGSGIKEFDIEIEKLSKQEYASTKSMVIKVTDSELINKTGGIVQGMSGSPIIQNGKLVGAVTHVFINDPTKGYGIYAQWMIEQME